MRLLVGTYDRLEDQVCVRMGWERLNEATRDTGRTYEGLEVDDPKAQRGPAEDLVGCSVSIERGMWGTAYLGM